MQQQQLKLKRGKLYRVKQIMLMESMTYGDPGMEDSDLLQAGTVLFLVDVIPDRDKGDEYFILTFILPDGEIIKQCFMDVNLAKFLELCTPQ